MRKDRGQLPEVKKRKKKTFYGRVCVNGSATLGYTLTDYWIYPQKVSYFPLSSTAFPGNCLKWLLTPKVEKAVSLQYLLHFKMAPVTSALHAFPRVQVGVPWISLHRPPGTGARRIGTRKCKYSGSCHCCEWPAVLTLTWAFCIFLLVCLVEQWSWFFNSPRSGGCGYQIKRARRKIVSTKQFIKESTLSRRESDQAQAVSSALV